MTGNDVFDITPTPDQKPEINEPPSTGRLSTLAGDEAFEKIKGLLEVTDKEMFSPGNLNQIIETQEMLMALNSNQFKQLFEKLGRDTAELLSQLFCKAMELGWNRKLPEITVARYKPPAAA